MLQQMRDNFTGTFAIVLLGVIGVSFIFFGIGNQSGLSSAFAAKVDGEEISGGIFEQNYRDAIQRNPQLASVSVEVRLQVRRNLLDQLIGEQLVENYLDDNGYRISDEQIKQKVQGMPEFMLNGVFDMGTYRTLLMQQGLDPIRYEQLQRKFMRQQQLQLAVGATGFVTPLEYRRYLNLFAEQRVVTIASISEEAVAEEIAITDEMILSFYDDNSTMYRLPESAEVEFIEIRRESVAEGIEITEEDLLAHYKESQGRYLQDEQRRARHILITFDDDEDAAETLANDLFARIQAGESFEDLATEYSADGGTASRGGDLGTLTRTQLPGELGSSIFSINAGEIDGPIEGEFGFHIVRVDEILERGPLPLDQVRGELLSELREREADDRFRDLGRALSDVLFDNNDMQVIADAVGLEIQTVAGFTRAGGEPLGSNQAAIDAIFADPVLTGGQVSDVVELDANRSAIFKVTTYNEAKRQPLDEVRDEVLTALTSQEAEFIMVTRAEQMLAAVAAGDDFGQAAESAGLAVSEPQILSRQDQNIDQALMFDVFAAGKPTTDSPLTGRVRTLDGAYVVYSLDAVLPGRPEAIPLVERDEGKLVIAQQSGVSDFQAFVVSLHENADIVINDDLLAANDQFQ
jgi:peptidyl-prolyl cis-trans isomerase D